MLKVFGPERYVCIEKKTQVEIHKNPFVVGRGATADLVLASLQVSRAHCKFSQSHGGKMWLLECLSVNGLKVDGLRLHPGEKKALPSESLISLADDLHLLFFPQFQGLHSRSIEIVDVTQIDTRTSVDQAPKPDLALCEERLSKAYADLAREQRLAAEQRNALQVRLNEEEKKVCDAKQRNETLDQELQKMLAMHAEELTKAKAAEVAEATIKQARAAEDQDLAKRLSELEKMILDAEQRYENLHLEMKTTLALHDEELSKARTEVDGATIKQAKAAEDALDLKKRLIEMEKRVLDAEQRYGNLHLQFKKTLSLNSDELSKSRAEIVEATAKQALAAEEVQNLQKRLSKEESKVLDAEQRNKHLEVEILEAHSKVFKNANKLEVAKKEASLLLRELGEAKQSINCLQLELAALQSVVTIKEAETGTVKTELEATRQEAAEFKASLRTREEENRNLSLEMISVQAMSSNLSDDVAKYKRYWEDSEVKSFAESLEKAKLAKEIAALKEQTTKLPEATDKQLNEAKVAARLDQVHEFEEFIETDLQCAICFELVIAATALNCGHTFCSKCVRDWQARSANCPTCRVQITTMQKCKMLDSFIARAAGKLSEEFRARRSEATGGRGTDSQGQPKRKKTRRTAAAPARRIDFDLPGPEPVPEAQFFVDLT